MWASAIDESPFYKDFGRLVTRIEIHEITNDGSVENQTGIAQVLSSFLRCPMANLSILLDFKEFAHMRVQAMVDIAKVFYIPL